MPKKNKPKKPTTKKINDDTVPADVGTQIASNRSYYLVDSLIDKNNPNSFITRKGFRTIDTMLNDEHVFGILEMKKFFILSTGYEFTYLEEGVKTSTKILEFVKDNFENQYTGLFQKDLYNILSCFEYGFSVSEKLYKVLNDKIYLARLLTVPPHSIEFQTDDMGVLSGIYQSQVSEEVQLPAHKMLLFAHNSNFDNPYGKSDLQRCYRSWLEKDNVVKFWNIYLQRFASPFPVATAPEHFGTAENQQLLNVLDSIQQAASLVVPEGTEIELHKVGNASAEYNLAIERMNQMIARALLIPDLLGFGQSTKGGSFALGEKQYDVFVAIVNFTRRQLEDLINDECIKPLVIMNFGEQKVYPKFKFKSYETATLTSYLELFLKSVEKGMLVTPEDYNHFRKKIDFPELDASVIAELEAKKEALLNKELEAKQPIQEKTEEKTEEKKEEFADTHREPTPYESRVDFIKEDKVITAREDVTIKDMSRLLKQMRESLKEDITRKKILENPSAINKIQLKNKGDLRRILTVDLQDMYNSSFQNAVKEIEDLGGYDTAKFNRLDDLIEAGRREAVANRLTEVTEQLSIKQKTPVTTILKREQKLLEKALAKKVITAEDVAEIRKSFEALDKVGGAAAKVGQISVKSVAAAKRAKEIITSKAFGAIGKVNDDILNKAKIALQQGVENGLSSQAVLSKIDDVFNPYVQGAVTDVTTAEPALLNTIVRTNYNTVYNQARIDVANSTDLGNFVEMYQYSAIMDDRTTDRCASLDGLIATKNDPIWGSVTPPNHYSCRSKLRYITKVDVEVDGAKPTKQPSIATIKKMPGGDFIN